MLFIKVLLFINSIRYNYMRLNERNYVRVKSFNEYLGSCLP